MADRDLIIIKHVITKFFLENLEIKSQTSEADKVQENTIMDVIGHLTLKLKFLGNHDNIGGLNIVDTMIKAYNCHNLMEMIIVSRFLIW